MGRFRVRLLNLVAFILNKSSLFKKKLNCQCTKYLVLILFIIRDVIRVNNHMLGATLQIFLRDFLTIKATLRKVLGAVN